ncbi:unextended protein [Diabrotica virgifera virgifera]|uniref:Metal transporter CNNM4 n=1 Tax=Diabrotica virgifera virgifera TaxID=50390 RepID=A0A6P7FC68_DIAVI|nr:unextended protein [Diabrotica virgifera virgifera]
MARYSPRAVEKILTILLLFVIVNPSKPAFLEDPNLPEFISATSKPPVEYENDKKIIFEVRGRNIQKDIIIKATKNKSERDSECEDLTVPYNISEIHVSEFKTAQYELTVPRTLQGDIYLCLPRQIKKPSVQVPQLFHPKLFYKWVHQGPNVSVNVTSDDSSLRLSLQRRQVIDQAVTLKPIVLGLRLEKAYKEPEFDEDGVPELLSNHDQVFRIFGENLTPRTLISFTAKANDCVIIVGDIFHIDNSTLSPTSARVTINLPASSSGEPYYLCAKDGADDSSKIFTHQGSHTWNQIKIHDKRIPLWATLLLIFVCLCFSACFSGLNLGLMSLDKTELKILCNTGTPDEKKYAKAIQPVRNHGNYLLCSILLGNVAVNSVFTVLLDDLTSGLVAVIFSTLLIVLVGEIAPQAICARHALEIGAKTIILTKGLMVLTFPLSYPVAKFLDCLLGEEIGQVYTRERLKKLVTETAGENDLDKDEVNIISGALELRKKTVAECMTKIEDVFMLDYEAILDFETVSEIMKSGFSRIPVFEGTRLNIVTMLYIKDLAFVDPDDNTPLKTLCQFYQNPCNFVFEDVTLDVMFKIFKEGNKGHMAFVHRVNNEGEGDPFYETVGLITLEDVIEELIQAEIMDETDVFTDNRSKRKRNAERRQDFTVFAEKRGELNKMRISPQLTLAAYQYLSTSVEPFHPNVISETILRRLLKQDIAVHIKKNKEWRTDPANIIYSQGKSVDFFVIILEGRVEVTVGKESLMFEGGPFTYFGTQALVQTVGIESPSVAASTMGSLESLNIDSLLRHTFIPDYSVRASTEVLYLKIKRSLYLAAKRASLMERSKKGEHQTQQQFDEEVDKLLHSLDEDDGISAGAQTPKRKSSRRSQEIKPENLSNLSSQTSPKTPSHYSNTSPPHRVSARDVNGSIKASPVDDIQIVSPKDEENTMLLPKNS